MMIVKIGYYDYSLPAEYMEEENSWEPVWIEETIEVPSEKDIPAYAEIID